eukprot:scaffold1736_cov127-Cylindrotheca_fusiformis.AAC.6
MGHLTLQGVNLVPHCLLWVQFGSKIFAAGSFHRKRNAGNGNHHWIKEMYEALLYLFRHEYRMSVAGSEAARCEANKNNKR